MEILNVSLHHIDHAINAVQEIVISNKNTQLSEYILSLIDSMASTSSKRMFYFRSETTEVRQAINLMTSERFSQGSIINAKRLLEIEKATQEKMNLNVEIQKGSLFQTVFREDDKNRIIICKADHNEYLDESDFILHKGLPWKKKVFKSIMLDLNPSFSVIESISVYDTNSSMSKYWWQDYLELTEKYTDSENTKRALHSMDHKIFKPLEKKHPSDYITLRNTMVGYFRRKEEFDVNDFVENVLEGYRPFDDNLSVDTLKTKVLEMPMRDVKREFDYRFYIDRSAINKRMLKTTVELNQGIELVLEGVESLNSLVKPGIDDEGNKYVKIRTTDKGYRYFGGQEE